MQIVLALERLPRDLNLSHPVLASRYRTHGRFGHRDSTLHKDRGQYIKGLLYRHRVNREHANWVVSTMRDHPRCLHMLMIFAYS
jgi:hypothetical protein